MLQFVFEVIVDGMKVFSKKNSQVHSHCRRCTVNIDSSFQAMEFKQMKVYASDPWYEPLPGQMKDLQYSTAHTRLATSIVNHNFTADHDIETY